MLLRIKGEPIFYSNREKWKQKITLSISFCFSSSWMVLGFFDDLTSFCFGWFFFFLTIILKEAVRDIETLINIIWLGTSMILFVFGRIYTRIIKAVFLSKISPKRDFNVNHAYFFYFVTWISLIFLMVSVVFMDILVGKFENLGWYS